MAGRQILHRASTVSRCIALVVVGASDDLTYTHDSLSVQLNIIAVLWLDGAHWWSGEQVIEEMMLRMV